MKVSSTNASIGDSLATSSATLLLQFRNVAGVESRTANYLYWLKEFDVFITVDRKLATQQDLKTFRIPVILIRARTNRLEHIRPLATELLERLSGAVAGKLTVVSM